MNHTARTTLGLIGACALAASLPAQSEPSASTTAPAPSPTTTTTATTSPTPTTAPARFTTFDGASPEVLTAVRNAQEAANAARINGVGPSGASVTDTTVSRAVAQASAAITQEGRVARADLLAERQAALTRLRLAQTAAERERLVADLRTQTGQRMDEQRETARLVRDRLRELRDSTALTPKPGGS